MHIYIKKIKHNYLVTFLLPWPPWPRQHIEAGIGGGQLIFSEGEHMTIMVGSMTEEWHDDGAVSGSSRLQTQQGVRESLSGLVLALKTKSFFLWHTSSSKTTCANPSQTKHLHMAKVKRMLSKYTHTHCKGEKNDDEEYFKTNLVCILGRCG